MLTISKPLSSGQAAPITSGSFPTPRTITTPKASEFEASGTASWQNSGD